MNIRHWFRGTLTATTTLAVVASLATAGPAAATPPQHAQEQREAKSHGVALADGALRETVDALRHGRSAPHGRGVTVTDNRVLVEMAHHLPDGQARHLVEQAGGRVVGSIEGALVEAFVPHEQLESLEAQPGVEYLQVPSLANVPEATNSLSGTKGVEAVTKTAADAWHTAGYTGSGVKVGIVDYFNSTLWSQAVTAKELPNPAGTFCRQRGATCSIWETGSHTAHGEGVAEIIHDLAPKASLYLARVGSASDLQAAVDWFVANGVRIVSRSLGSQYDGPGNGTGPLANVVANAASRGITWFNSAGNSAGTATNPGSYWRGSWRDADGDRWLDFRTGDELLAFHCDFISGVRWSDWGTARTDYDVYVYDDSAGTVLEMKADADQSIGLAPIEKPGCSGTNDTDYLAIKLYAAGSGTSGDVLEFMTGGSWVEYWSNPYSATQPVADMNNAGVMAVGAVDPALGTTIAGYSSQGPSNDGRIKPDLSAAACISSYTYRGTTGNGCFNGTSAATPVAAGVSALALQRWTATTPAQLKTWLLGKAVVDRGTAGADNVYGAGELRLPPPNDHFASSWTLTTTTGSVTGSTIKATKETGEPAHAGNAGGASVWFTWKAPYSRTVTIKTAGSNFDTLLGVYTGTSVGALTKVAANDDVSSTDMTSRVQFTAVAGRTYRIAVDGYDQATGTVKLTWAG